ncbi:MAG TPA: hypothetical protein PK677_16810 [Acidiphilium sp.]|nr:hypothetical protein [Acidiphilium sp.]
MARISGDGSVGTSEAQTRSRLRRSGVAEGGMTGFVSKTMAGRGLPEAERAELVALKNRMKSARDRLYHGIKLIDQARSCRDLAEMKRLAGPVLAAFGPWLGDAG